MAFILMNAKDWLIYSK